MESITRLRWNRRKREVPRASSFPSKRSNRTWTWTTRFSPCLRRNRKQRNPRLENNLLHREFPTICLNKRMPFRYQIAEDNDMNKSIRCLVAVMVLVAGAPLFADRALAQEAKVDSDTISGLGARNIGSAAMSGRVAAIAAVKENGRLTVYVGAASGGVWKSTNGGTTFKPVFDKEPVESIGAITVDPQSPKTIWVGTGEAWTRNSVSVGDGIYKSTDGGDSWHNMGLPNAERISRILVDPKDSDTVYVCVPGKLWSDSEDRGVYKTTDGGKTWNKILKGPNPSTGCSMISMNSGDPKVHRDHRATRRRIRTFQDFVPGFAAVGGFVDAAIFAVAPELARHAHVNCIAVFRVDQNPGNALGIGQSHVVPTVTAVG